MINLSSIIEKHLKVIGQPVTFVMADGSEEHIFAVVDAMHKRNRAKFEDVAEKIGRNYNDYRILISPASFNIFDLGEENYFVTNGDKYKIIKPERITAGKTTLHYWSVVKKLREEDENVFS